MQRRFVVCVKFGSNLDEVQRLNCFRKAGY